MTVKLAKPIQNKSISSPFTYFLYDTNSGDYVVPFHYHEDQQLFVVCEGKVSISVNSIPHVLEKGDCVIYPSYCVHSMYPLQKDTRVESIAFNIRELFDLSQPHFSLLKKIVTHQIEPGIVYSSRNYPEVTKVACQIIESYKSEGISAVTMTISKILEFFALASCTDTVKTYEKEIANRYYKYYQKSTVIYKYICDNYRKEVTLEELSQAVDLSEKYFCKFFKELTDLRPMEFLNMFRIEAAAIELAISPDSINEVASRCGFKDPCYFTKLFRRFKGSSPRDFRDSIPNKNQKSFAEN